MVIDRLKKLLGRDEGIPRSDMARLKGLPEDEREKELQSVLYEMAFQNAAQFVYEELKKTDSTFSRLERNAFFQEMLIMNFWMMRKVFLKYRKEIAEKMHHHYFGSLPDIALRTADMEQKFSVYNLCWDEYSGHHDEFGVKAGQYIFGSGVDYPERTVSFWIIEYADQSMKKFRKVRRQCREAGLIHKGE